MRVRHAANSNQGGESQRNVALCREATYAPHLYSITASVRAMRLGMATLSAAEISSFAAVECYADGRPKAAGRPITASSRGRAAGRPVARDANTLVTYAHFGHS
jgi:hypothetical protein